MCIRDSYRTIFESTGTAMIIIDEDTTISLANSEFVHLSGYPREEIENRQSWQLFVEAEDVERQAPHRPVLRQHERSEHDPGDAERHVHPEHPRPVQVLQDQSADDGAEDRPEHRGQADDGHDPAEVVAAAPFVVAAPIDAVIEEVAVEPSAVVKAGDVWVRFTDTWLRNRVGVARRGLGARARQRCPGGLQEPVGADQRLGGGVVEGVGDVRPRLLRVTQGLARERVEALRAPLRAAPVPVGGVYQTRGNPGLFGQMNYRAKGIDPCFGPYKQHTRVGWAGASYRVRAW